MRQEFDTSPNTPEALNGQDAQALGLSQTDTTTDSATALPAETLTGQRFKASGKQPKYTRLSLDEKQKILTLRAQGLIPSLIAKAVNRSLPTICEFLEKYPDTRNEALAILQSGAGKAAQAWIDSLEPAAKQGNFKGAKELLASTGVIRETADTQVAVQVNLGQGGESLPTDLSFTVDKIESES